MKLPLLDRLSIKRRQSLLTVASVGALFVTVLGGLWLTSPRQGQTDKTPAQRSAADIVKNYRTPGESADPADVWITNSEAKLKNLNAANLDLQNQFNELKGQLLALETKTNRQGDIAVPPLPGEGLAQTTPALPSVSNVPTSSPSDSTDSTGNGTHSRGPISFPKEALPPPPSAMLRGANGSPVVIPPSGILEVSLAAPADATPPSQPGTAPANGGTTSAGAATAAGSKTAAPASTIENTLPAGAFTSAVLLTGLDAPTGGTAKTNPIPLLMRLLDGGTLPNRFHARVRDCFVTGAGYGDLSAERAYIRLEQLSCVMKDGRIIDNTIEGFIAGEDGKNGLRGKVVSKQGQMIGMALLAGFASGMGQSVSASYSNVSTSPLGSVSTVNPGEVLQSGAASGIGKALDKIADFYIQRANDLFPVIEVDSARRGDIILTKPAALGAVYGEAWEDGQ